MVGCALSSCACLSRSGGGFGEGFSRSPTEWPARGTDQAIGSEPRVGSVPAPGLQSELS